MKTDRSDSVRIADFKARLSQYLRKVRQGHPLTLLDRNTPIARVMPYPPQPGGLRIRKPTQTVEAVRLPPPLRKRIDSLGLLREERQGDR